MSNYETIYTMIDQWTLFINYIIIIIIRMMIDGCGEQRVGAQ